MAQVQTIPKGYSWSDKKLKTNQDKHQYSKVGAGETGHLSLSGAVKRWTVADKNGVSHAGDIYLPDFRVVGTQENLTYMLQLLGYDNNQIDAILAQGYSASNYNTSMKSQFDNELQQYRQYKEGVKVTKGEGKAPNFILSDLDSLVNAVVGAPASKRPAGTPKTGRGGAGRVKSIAVKLQEARNFVNKAGVAEPKVLDVSAYDPMTGKGIKSIKKPGANSKKLGFADLEIISSSPTNYALAVRSLNLPNGESYINEYNRIFNERENAKLAGALKPIQGGMVAQPVNMAVLGSGLSPRGSLTQIPSGLNTRFANNIALPPALPNNRTIAGIPMVPTGTTVNLPRVPTIRSPGSASRNL
jgi:hypothetical protein